MLAGGMGGGRPGGGRGSGTRPGPGRGAARGGRQGGLTLTSGDEYSEQQQQQLAPLSRSHNNANNGAMDGNAMTFPQQLAAGISGMQAFSGGISKSERALVAGTDGSVAAVEERITQAVQTFGLAPGAQKMMDAEKLAAEEAMETGLYGIWRNSTSQHDFCGRIGPMSRCFCGHDYSEHQWDKGRKKLRPKCGSCSCAGFRYIPRRPEEVGEYWLPRRRGFNIHLWQAKCKCQHGHSDHDPNRLGCRAGCSCPSYTSAWLCTSCEGKWEDHESLWETEEERRLQGLPVGQAFFPLHSTPQIQDIAFNKGSGSDLARRSHSLPHKPKPERSVKLMQERCPNYGAAAGSNHPKAITGGGPSSSSSAFSGGLEDAFPPARRAPAGFSGGLEDAFPPVNRAAPRSDFVDPMEAPLGGGRRSPGAVMAEEVGVRSQLHQNRPPSGGLRPGSGRRSPSGPAGLAGRARGGGGFQR